LFEPERAVQLLQALKAICKLQRTMPESTVA
jgi:hypothetical protein